MQALLRKSTTMSRLLLAVATLCVSVSTVLAVALPTSAINTGDACRTIPDSAVCRGKDENVGGRFGANLVNTMLFVLGILAVVMIIVGGIKYATADGDSSKITSAKNTILYSVVGLIVAIMAWGIVTFVVTQFR